MDVRTAAAFLVGWLPNMAIAAPPPVAEPMEDSEEWDGTPVSIYGGSETSQFPQVVLIEITAANGVESRCSGTVISDRWVLTAAHCIDNIPNNGALSYLVVVGDDWTDKQVAVDAGYLNPTYSAACNLCGNDVALLKLSDPLDDVTPMGISVDPNDITEGDSLIYVGFGATEAEEFNKRILKRKINLPTTFVMDELVFGEDPSGVKGACFGDSGGAVLKKFADGYRLVGVMSYVENDDCSGEVASGRPVSQLEWIQSYGVPYTTSGLSETETTPTGGCGWLTGPGAANQLKMASPLGLFWLGRRRSEKHRRRSSGK